MPTLDPVALAALPIGTPNAQVYASNAGALDAVVNGAGAVLSRTGKQLLSIDEALRRIGYETPVAFASGIAVSRATQTVVSGGLTYHANPASLPFTTTGTFNGAQWLLVSGVTAQDLASQAAGKGMSLLGVQDAAGYYNATNAESALAEVGAYIRGRCNPKMEPWRAKFDGVTDDTAAINACMEYARANNLTIELPAGTAIVTNLLYGTQATGGQSSAPPGMIGAGPGATRFKAKAGASGVLLKAWSIAGATWRGFSVDCNSQPGLIGIDTTWKPGAGPSLQCVFDSVWVDSYASTGWLADHNNDVSFFKCNARSPILLNQVAFQIRASGGMVSMRDCTWSSGLLDIGAQNVELTGCWGHGIRFHSGATNVALLNACYLYGSPVTNTIISTNGTAAGTKIQSIELNGCWIDCTQGYSVINARIGSGVKFNGCTFSPTGGTIYALLLGAGCTRDLTNGRVNITLSNCRAEYNSTAGAPLVIDFAAPQWFSVTRSAYDASGIQVNDSGYTIEYSQTLGVVTAGQWRPLTGGNELSTGMWAISVLWDCSPVGYPYYVSAATVALTIRTNAALPGAAFSGVNCDDHTHAGLTIGIRPAANTTGLAGDFDWLPPVSLTAGSKLVVRCSKLA